MRSPRDRFWEKVERSGDDSCWLWAGYKKRGYGQFRESTNRTVMAHRFAYEDQVGPIQDGLEIDHLCRIRSCVNPRHLEAVTPRVNTRRWQIADGVLAGASACPKGHHYDAENTYHSPAGRRVCRTCVREANRRSYLKRKTRVVS